MSSGAYSPDKASWWQDRLATLRQGGHPAPVHVQLILSDLCNQDCHFCAYRMSGYSSNQLFPGPNGEKNPNRQIPFTKAMEIVQDCAEMGVKAIQFTGGGEPTVHPHLREVVRYANSLGMKTALVTNGVLFRKQFLESDMEEWRDFSWVRFSIDAGKPGTYAKIRNCPESHFGTVLETIRELCSRRMDKKPSVGIGFVVTEENYPEILEATAIAKEIGADNIRISAAFQPDGAEYFHRLGYLIYSLATAAENLSDSNFQVHNRLSEKIGDLQQGAPDYEFCGYQHFTTYIGGDLSLYRCCVTSYNERGYLGSLKNQRFKDLWVGEAKDRMKSFDARGCSLCQFNDRNRSILSLVKEPVHAEFV